MIQKKTENKVEQKQNKPIQVFQSGSINVSIWENDFEDKEQKINRKFYTITTQRSYTKDDGKNWEHTTSMRTNDLPKLILCLNKAYEFLAITERE